MKTGAVNTHVEGAQEELSSSSDALGRFLPNLGSDRLFGVDIAADDDPSQGLDADVYRSIQWLALLMLGFFVIITLVAIHFINANHAETERERSLVTTSQVVANLDSKLAKTNAWLATAANAPSPARMVGVAVRGDGAAAAAFIGDNGAIIAEPAESGDLLASQASNAQRNPGDVEIKRIVAGNGDANALFVRHVRGGQLMLALAGNHLVTQDQGPAMLVSPTGLVVDGPPSVISNGVLSALGLTDAQLASLTQNSGTPTSQPWTLNGTRYWLSSARIPDSNLSLLQLTPRTKSPHAPTLWLAFLCLFVGTAIIIATMMAKTLGSLKKVQTTFEADEVTRQRYQAAIEGTGGGVFEIDLGASEVFLSKPLVQILNLGTDQRQIPLNQFLALVQDNSREQFYSHIRRAHMTGEFKCDLQVNHLPIVLSCQAQPTLRSEPGSDIPTRKVIVGVARDVTEQRGAQMRLKAAESRLFNALRSMTDAFVVWDPLERLVLWNARFEDFFGFKPGNLRPGLDRATVDYYARANVEETFEIPGQESMEIKLKDGRWLRYLESATEDGSRVTIATDVTEIREREELLRQNNDVLERQYDTLNQTQSRLLELAQEYEVEKIRAEEANQSKSEFLANMSHELRTPLNAINGFSDIMQKEMFGPLGDPRYKEYVNDILFSGKHLLSLINDILDMSKIEAGKMSLNTDNISVDSMISQVVRIVRGRAEENRLRLLYNQTETQSIVADPRAVKQILLNLISNAIKFTPEGGTVKVTLVGKQTGVVIRVADSGMGISEDDLARLAQPFEQASNNKSGEGTGLGLALSKSLVELHGGNFHISSRLGQGTNITFTLPNSPAPVDRQASSTSGVSEEISRIAGTISAALEQGRESSRADVVENQEAVAQAAAPAVQTPPGPVPYVPPAA